jgi:hypothetical protein
VFNQLRPVVGRALAGASVFALKAWAIRAQGNLERLEKDRPNMMITQNSIYITVVDVTNTSTAQSGGGSFKDRSTIGKVELLECQ